MVLKSFKEFEFREESFSLNISYLDIKSNGFLKFLTKNIKKYNVGKKLVLELLEDEKIENEEVLNKFILEVRKEGVKISIDDFGSGYSNFGRLVKLKIDYLKIDSELIKDLEKENNYKIVKGIVDFSKSLNLEVVAEYVENEKIFNIVKELGINFSQGYYFSKPLQRIVD
jgi:EAL domain-containing protein (putative c-di-GMP-specific phosphodiesterase class I)